MTLAYAAAIVAVALVILAGAALWWRRGERQAGRDQQKLRQQEASNEIQREMLDAATRRPRDRDDLARRLRDGTF